MTCNFKKPNLVWGFHIRPWNPFSHYTRICNSRKDCNQNANASFTLLFPRFRTYTFDTNDRGIFPSIWLWLKSKVIKLHPCTNDLGKFPWKQLFFIFNTKRELLKWPKHGGIWLINWLLDIPRTSKEFDLQIIWGLLLVRLLFEAKVKISCRQENWEWPLQHVWM